MALCLKGSLKIINLVFTFCSQSVKFYSCRIPQSILSSIVVNHICGDKTTCRYVKSNLGSDWTSHPEVSGRIKC